MELLERHFDIAFDAPDGIKKLRELILTLAMQGKLVPQDPKDQPASELLKEIEAEKKQLVKRGKIKEPKPLSPISPEEMPCALPKGWEWVRLGDSMLKITDGTHHSPPNGDRGDFLYISAKNIKDDGVMLSNATYVTQDVHEEIYSRCDPEHGNILYIKDGATTGIVTINDIKEPFSMLSSVALLKQPKGINNRYLLFVLKAPFFYAAMRAGMTGVAITRVTLNKLQDAVIPLAPHKEQLRIVAKIDELMARCDALEKLRAERDDKRLAVHTAAVRQLMNVADTGGHLQAREFLGQHFGELYTVKENVIELRKAVLQLAVMGKLVPQAPNDPPASELLKQIEAEKKRLVKAGKIRPPKALPVIRPDEAPFSLPKGWEWIRIAEVAQQITSGSRDWAKYYSTSGAIFVTMGNLSRGSYQLRMDTIRYVSPPSDSEGARTKLEEGDLLISITADVGNLGLIPAGFGEAYINQHTCLLRLMPACRNRYFAELLRSPLAKEQFDAPQRGIKNSFRLDDVGEMIVPLPPFGTQQRIVTEIDRLMSMCDTLEQQIDAAGATQSALLNAMMAQYGGQRCA